MTTVTTRVERSGPAVRAALAEFSPEECALFEEEFRRALLAAGRRFDLGPAQAVLDRWWSIATLRANPLAPDEQELLARARSGDDAGWAADPRDEGTPVLRREQRRE